jgi:hypothetical protein
MVNIRIVYHFHDTALSQYSGRKTTPKALLPARFILDFSGKHVLASFSGYNTWTKVRNSIVIPGPAKDSFDKLKDERIV